MPGAWAYHAGCGRPVNKLLSMLFQALPLSSSQEVVHAQGLLSRGRWQRRRPGACRLKATSGCFSLVRAAPFAYYFICSCGCVSILNSISVAVANALFLHNGVRSLLSVCEAIPGGSGTQASRATATWGSGPTICKSDRFP